MDNTKKNTYPGYTNARKDANAEYRKKIESIQIYVKKGEKDKIKAYANANGKSVNQFIVDLIYSVIGE